MAAHHDPDLHQRDPTGRFSDRGDDYRRYRPGYPSAAIDAVLEGLGPAPALHAADVGAGTGISARLFAERGVRVWAIEPNAAMRAQATPHPRITWLDAAAERTGLPDAAVDLVLCAQAFHWFDPDAALGEFRRILRPGGRVALVWNDRDEADPFTRVYGDLLRVASGNDPAMESHTRPGALERCPMFRGVRRVEVPNEQRLDRPGIVGRALSASYVPKAGPAHGALVAGLAEAHARFADGRGLVTLRYTTRLFLAEAVPDGVHRGENLRGAER